MRRRGNVIMIVVVLATVVLAALFSLGFLTRTDVTSSVRLLREVRATMLAESVAAQIESQTNGRPWRKRFWLIEAQASGALATTPVYTLDAASPYLDLSKDATPADDYEVNAVVKDLDDELREYRLFVEIRLGGEPYGFSWDKRWRQSLLSGMNRDGTQIDKPLELEGIAAGGQDRLIDSIRARADGAPPPEGADAAQKARLDGLRQDEPSFSGSAQLGTVEAPLALETLPEGL